MGQTGFETRPEEKLCSIEGCRAFRLKNSPGGYCIAHSRQFEDVVDRVPNIIEVFEDEKLFGALIKNQDTWFAWKTLMKAIFHTTDEPSEAELETFKELTGRSKWNHKQFREVHVVAGRRSGKSMVSSMLACYMALFQKWNNLSKGEKGYFVLVASDRSQAQILLDYCRTILELPAFRSRVKKIKREDIFLDNNLVISIKTCSIAGVRGWTCPVILADEIGWWRSKETSVNLDSMVLASLRPTQATLKDKALLVTISSPYAKRGILWEMYDRYYGVDHKDILVVQSPSIKLNPTLDEKWIEEQIERDPITNRSEYEAVFRSDIASYLSNEVIENAVYPDRGNLPPVKDVKYFGFVDGASGSGKDSYAMAIGHRTKEGVVEIDLLVEKVPKFKPEEVTKEFAKHLRDYGISRVVGDRYSGGWIENAFKDNGIAYEPSKRSASEIYLEFAPYIIQGRVVLPDNKKLLSQMRGLERRTRQQGNDLVTHFSGGHDDLSVVVAGVSVELLLEPHDTLESMPLPEPISYKPVFNNDPFNDRSEWF